MQKQNLKARKSRRSWRSVKVMGTRVEKAVDDNYQ